MKVEVVFYGRLKEFVDSKHEVLELNNSQASIKQVLSVLAGRHATLMRNMDSVAYVVNDEVVDMDFELGDGDVISFLPPVSGG